MAGKGVLAIGDYGLCITLAASASASSSLHFVPCAAASSEGECSPRLCSHLACWVAVERVCIDGMVEWQERQCVCIDVAA
jgi:hypothetical protein